MTRPVIGSLLLLCATILLFIAATGGAHVVLEIVVAVGLVVAGVVTHVQDWRKRHRR